MVKYYHTKEATMTNECTSIVGHFNGHGGAPKQYRWHCLMQHVQDYPRSHWMLPLGNYLVLWGISPVVIYFTYIRLTFLLKGWSIRKILLQVRHRKSARRAGCISGTPCSLVSCLQVWCTHQNHFSRPATAFTSFSALILLNHDE